MDIVYCLSNGSLWDNNELRLSLRSLEKNVEGIGNVYVIGEKPKWIKNVIHIPFKDEPIYSPDGNIIRKILRACQEKKLSDNFLFGSDDQLITKKCKVSDLKAYHDGDIRDKKPEWLNANQVWRKRFKRTYERLLKENKPTYSYDSHIITPYNKQRFIEVMSMYPEVFDRQGYTINTIFLNNCDIEREHIENRKMTCYRKDSLKRIIERFTDKMYIGYNDNGLNVDLKCFLMMLFPTMSKYEQTDINDYEKNYVLFYAHNNNMYNNVNILGNMISKNKKIVMI